MLIYNPNLGGKPQKTNPQHSPNSFGCRGSHGLAKGPRLVCGSVRGCRGASLFVIYNILADLPSKTFSKVEN